MVGDPDDGSTVTLGKPSSNPGRYRAVILIDGIAQYFPLPASGDVRIGRFTKCYLIIDRDTVSRFHAVLHMGLTVTIEDLGSANGTFVRDKPARPGHPIPVDVGDVIRIGDVTLLLENSGK